ncbi:MAG: T9SS type A sorting domain-containing protein, partial [Pseudomonadota bacterium]
NFHIMKTTLLTFLSLIILMATYGQSISAVITPNPVAAGNDVTIDITFTSSVSTDIIQLNLERVDAGYVYVSTVDYQEYVVPSTGTDQTVQYTVTIPSDLTPSSDISTDFYYYKIELRDSGYKWKAGYYEDPLTVDSALSISDFNSEAISLFPNPVENILNVTSESLLIGESYSVYNLLGKEVIRKQFGSDKSINVEKLSSGLYILKLENLAPVKFLKK